MIQVSDYEMQEFRRCCREEYVEIGSRLGAKFLEEDAEECREAADWFTAEGQDTSAARAAARGEVAVEVAALGDEKLSFEARRLRSARGRVGPAPLCRVKAVARLSGAPLARQINFHAVVDGAVLPRPFHSRIEAIDYGNFVIDTRPAAREGSGS